MTQLRVGTHCTGQQLSVGQFFINFISIVPGMYQLYQLFKLLADC